jgi:hypothetical protein
VCVWGEGLTPVIIYSTNQHKPREGERRESVREVGNKECVQPCKSN